MIDPDLFDPYALFEALDRERVSYLVVGAFARVIHGSGEVTDGLDIVPALRQENLRRLTRSLNDLDASAASGAPIEPDQLMAGDRFEVETRAGTLTIVPKPWGTRGYDGLRIRANREHLGRNLRPQVASIVDLARMLEASNRDADRERLTRLRRLMEIQRQLSPRRGSGIGL